MAALTIHSRIPRISVCTAWLDHPELIPDYEEVVKGADEVVIVDNGSDELVSAELVAMLTRLGYPEKHRYLRQKENGWFSGPMNEGIAAATGDIILALNNDVRLSADPKWLNTVRREVQGTPGLFGPAASRRTVPGRVPSLHGPTNEPFERPLTLPYVEGWCIAATRETWDRLGGFDAEAFERPYWEDVDLSFRAMCMGIPLYRTDWYIDHLSNTTSAVTPGAYDHSETNRITFETRVREFLSRKEEAHEPTAQAAAV